MNPVQAAMLQMGGFVGGAQPAGQSFGGGGGGGSGGGMAPGFAQFGIVPLAQLQGGAQGGLQAVPLAGLTLVTPQVRRCCWHLWKIDTSESSAACTVQCFAVRFAFHTQTHVHTS